jgi:DNA-binding transcriptional LysR family regulator
MRSTAHATAFCSALFPVVAPNFLPFPISNEITAEHMRDYTQCIVRDTARHSARRDYYLVEGARTCTVSDQMMKKEIILQGKGWGHMPTFLIADELRDGDRRQAFARRWRRDRCRSSARSGARPGR